MIMGFKSLTTRITLAFGAFDVILNPFIIAEYAQMLGIGAAPNYVLVMSGLVILKVAICAAYIRKQFYAYEVFASLQESERNADVVLRADERLQRGVIHFCRFYA